LYSKTFIHSDSSSAPTATTSDDEQVDNRPGLEAVNDGDEQEEEAEIVDSLMQKRITDKDINTDKILSIITGESSQDLSSGQFPATTTSSVKEATTRKFPRSISLVRNADCSVGSPVFASKSAFRAAFDANKTQIEEVVRHILTLSDNGRENFFSDKNVVAILDKRFKLDPRFVPYFATPVGQEKMKEVSGWIASGDLTSFCIDMLHMLPAPRDMQNSTTNKITRAMDAATENLPEHKTRTVFRTECFPCSVDETTYLICNQVKHCKALVTLVVLAQIAAFRPLTRALKAVGGNSGLFATKRVILVLQRELQIKNQSTFSRFSFDWHTLALSISERARLYKKMRFLWEVTENEAERIITTSVKGPLDEARKIANVVKQVNVNLKEKLIARLDKEDRDGGGSGRTSGIVRFLQISQVILFLKENTSSQDVASWHSRNLASISGNRIFVYDPLPEGTHSICNLEECRFDCSGIVPYLSVEANAEGTLVGKTVRVYCHGKNHPKRGKPFNLSMLSIRNEPVYWDYFKKCCDIRGCEVPRPPQVAKRSAMTASSAAELPAYEEEP